MSALEIKPYWSIIHQYIPPSSKAYQFYLPHVILVSEMAIRIANRLSLSQSQIELIESVAMLHDIGICRVDAPEIGCFGPDVYIRHGIIGREILESHGLKSEALVCERHTGVGITKAEIEKNNLPLPHREMTPQAVHEEIICYADTFFSKKPDRIFYKYTIQEIVDWFSKFEDKDRKIEIFQNWVKKFGE